MDEAIDLQKIVNETIAGVIASVRFLGRYFQEVWLLAIQPRKFAVRFLTIPEGRGRFAGATLFLFTTILILEVCLNVADRVIDASKSADIGAGVLLQSGAIWEVSWEALLKSAIPLSLGLLGTGWIISRLCGKGRSEQAWLLDIFPYFLWRSTVLTLIITVLISFGIALLTFMTVLITKGTWVPFLFFAFFLKYIILVAALLILFLTLWRLAPFMEMLRGDHSDIAKTRVRWFLFRLAVLGRV